MELNTVEIMKLLPHRYPMLLVDRVECLSTSEYNITAIKNVSANEWFFPGHFPREPLMPGVLIVEAMAQTAAILGMQWLNEQRSANDMILNLLSDSNQENAGSVYLSTIDSARFREKVSPGDTLVMHVQRTAGKRGFWKFSGTSHVAGKLVTECSFSAFLK
jgi:3-hydroxyacyl-[acyl-carrier-protein] dehydratase